MGGAQTAIEQRLLPIEDCNTVYTGTFLICGDAICQVLSHSENVWTRRYKGDDREPPCEQVGDKCVKQIVLSLEIYKTVSLCRGEIVVSEYCMGKSSAMDDQVRLKLLGYDTEVVGYAMVQAARDLDVEANNLRSRDPTHCTRYWVLAINGDLSTPHCGQIVKPCRKTRRYVEHTVWEYCLMF
ncbi:UNVERIFIED_CONTAM: hypothetical protein Sindi_2829600 [Sesamum indicum]